MHWLHIAINNINDAGNYSFLFEEDGFDHSVARFSNNLLLLSLHQIDFVVSTQFQKARKNIFFFFHSGGRIYEKRRSIAVHVIHKVMANLFSTSRHTNTVNGSEMHINITLQVVRAQLRDCNDSRTESIQVWLQRRKCIGWARTGSKACTTQGNTEPLAGNNQN